MARALLWIFLAGLAGCASIPTSPARPPELQDSRAVHFIKSALPVAQRAYQCGPAALESALRRWGREAAADEIGRSLTVSGRGVLDFALVQAARDRGFWTEVREGRPEDLRVWIRRDIPPIVLLHAAPLGIPVYHYILLRGFNDTEGIFYANTGQAETRAIRYGPFSKRWKEAGYWTLIVCPPERVDWEVTEAQAAELGVFLEQKGRLDLAERWYRTAIEKNPKSMTGRFNLANIYLQLGRQPEAKAIYQQLFREEPGWAPAGNNLAWLWLEEGKPAEALRVIETAFKNGAERRYDILDTLGLAYGRLHRYAQARQCFIEALEKVPVEHPERKRLIRAHQAEFSAL